MQCHHKPKKEINFERKMKSTHRWYATEKECENFERL